MLNLFQHLKNRKELRGDDIMAGNNNFTQNICFTPVLQDYFFGKSEMKNSKNAKSVAFCRILLHFFGFYKKKELNYAI